MRTSLPISIQVVKIFLNNSAPMNILKVPQSVRCLDLNLSHTKLAVIDDTLTLYVYDLKTQELLFQEPNAITVFWNTAFDDMISFSGVGELRIKANGFKLFTQKMAVCFTKARLLSALSALSLLQYFPC